MRVSLFMDPLPDGDGAGRATLGADRVELYTESYAQRARHAASRPTVLAAFAAAAEAAQRSAWASTPATT